MDILKTIRVLDVSAFVTGPLTGMLLGDFGAEVIKVESPDGGDPLRAYYGEDLYSPNYQSQNRNKRSITLDYTKAAGLEVLHRLAADVDVFIVNSRPGVVDKRSIDYETIRKINPKVIYCSITGFGKDGPYALRPAFDNVGQAISGWSSRVRYGDDPRVASPLVADPATAYFATMGVLAALYERERSGEGRLVEVNMLESMLTALVEPITRYFVTGDVPHPLERAAISQAYNLTCKDGKRIGLHASALDKFFYAMCEAVGRPDMISTYPKRDDRVRGYEEIAAILATIFRERTRDEWMPILEKAGFPFAPQYELDELEHDEQVRHLESFHTIADGRGRPVRMIRRPVWIDGSRDVAHRAPPLLGEHTDEILRQAGFDGERIEALRQGGVI
jgi:crotonobetainyl-CoA:carnitine CoA-transferase CaiB-like acyl-CoA transferase